MTTSMSSMKRCAVTALLSIATLAASQAFAETSLRLMAADVDSLYPNSCHESGCYPSRVPDGSGGWSLGFTGSETIVAWHNVHFPGNPLRIEVEYASGQNSRVDFYFAGGPNDNNGLYFWWCDFIPTYGTDMSEVYRTQTTILDYNLLGAVDLSGTHDLFLGFNCASAGCGNYRSFTFYFDGAAAGELEPGHRTVSTPPATRVSVIGAGTAGSRTGLANPSLLLYDMRGRRLGGHTLAPNNHRGVIITKAAR